ncbi:DUF6677 family protein [Paenibacillus sp. NPDC056579]|uniref:DUF6677 family protein n=1 Tax=unclassified Paenibacillus TaxID=185978 RepID=UPI001EF90A59|nr:DUF6677 family protein [Paenibacillus sp. H1-7]ULL18716.1 hypothetical protein DVH26_32340 [Paenibacillus sp. H1-7]
MEEQRKDPLRSNPEEEREDAFLRERMERWSQSAGTKQPFDPFRSTPRKSKLVACLLSFLIPGTGQLYLGQMQRGMMIMLVLILDIFAIVFFATHSNSSIPLIVLFSLFVPVIYFYNIFDALQQTDRVNGQWSGPYSDPLSEAEAVFKPVTRRMPKGSTLGYLLIIGGVFLFLVSSKPDWLNRIFDMLGSSIGAILLIVVGIVLFLRESTKK